MKKIVISGINLREGGPLSIYKDFLSNIISLGYTKKYEVIVLVCNKELFDEFSSDVRIIDFPKSQKNWFNRMYYEYVQFKSLSKKMDVYYWISLHDITPNVKAQNKMVYCHNPSPFLKMNFKQMKFGSKSFLFSKFYKYLYRINLKKNIFIVVQQNWIREEFMKMYGIEKNKIIVARPSIMVNEIIKNKDKSKEGNEYTFIFPSVSRFFKNFEVIGEASKILVNKGILNFKVILTMDGSENEYSKYVVEKYKNIRNIDFTGLLKREKLFELFEISDCMIFPSKLETWGLPISEFKGTGKPLLVADLPYAHETVGTYDKVIFFDPNKADELAELMEKEIVQKNIYIYAVEEHVKDPFARDWIELLKMIL